MTSSPPKLQSVTQKVTLTIKSGPNRGESFQLLPPKVSIGRGNDNDIALQDVKCSRAQAVIHVSPPRYFIEDVSSRGTTLVNNNVVKVQELRSGDLITVGETEIEFNVQSAETMPALRPDQVSPLAAAPAWSPGYQSGPAPEARQRKKSDAPAEGNRARFYMIVGVIGLVLYLLLSGDGAKKTEDAPLRSPEEMEKDLEKTQERLSKLAEQKQFRTPEENQRFQEAHNHYLSGFRDFQKGQYARALRAFETARAIDPNHELAQRYAVLAERKRDEWITLQMMEGRRYLEKSMYSRCSAALDKVMDEIANSQDLKFKEAQALKAECELMRRRKY